LRLSLKLLPLLLILPFATRAAGSASDTSGTQLPGPSRQTARYRGVVVDSIVIENNNIFDTSSKRYRHFIFRMANKLHYKTRRNVIKREILIKMGEAFSPELAEETARNLRQRLALYDAWIETEMLANGHLLVRIVTIDEWSLSGGLNISREGNKTEYELALAERNLLGNNQYLSTEYIVQSSDDDYVAARFLDRRFFGSPYTVEFGYRDDPLSTFRQVSFGHPFYDLSQTYSFDLTVATTGGRREIHNDDLLVGWSNNEGDQFKIGGAYRIGSYKRKVWISSQYAYRFERSFDRTITDTTTDSRLLAISSFPSDSLYHQVSGGLRLSNLEFVMLKRIDGFGYTEDFVLGQALQVGYARALTGDFMDYVFDVFDLGFSEGYRRGSNLAFLTYQRMFWFRGDEDFRRVTQLLANYYGRVFTFLTIAARGVYTSDWRAGSAEALTVGGRGDIRGFDEFFETGGRKGVLNLEGRFYPNVEFLSVLFGGAVFVDVARTWKAEERLSLKDFYASAGVGLRIGLERSSKNRLLRIDLAYSDRNGWQLSIGTDQYFKAQAGSFLLTTP
jgi:outer membrane protein assembly factor BamA